MTDCLDWYGDQLREAGVRRRRRAIRNAAVAVAVPALAAVVVVVAGPGPDVERPALPQPTPTWTPPPAGTWTPAVGRPEAGLDASISRAPISRAMAEAVAVLRRPQTDEDRQVAGPLLRWVGAGTDGVQVDAARALDARQALVPVETFGMDLGPGLCVVDRGGAACAPAERVPLDGVTSLSSGSGGTRYTGVVPDGVALVRFTPQTGAPIEAPVRVNFYDLRIPTTAEPDRVRPPAGWRGPVGDDGRIASPPMPAMGRLDWLDADGKVVSRRR